METYHLLLLVLLLLVGHHTCCADLEVKASKETGFDTKSAANNNTTSNGRIGGSNPVLDSVAKEVNGKPVGRSNEGFENDLGTGNSSKQLEIKRAHGVQTKKGSSSEELPVKESDIKQKSGEGLRSKEGPVRGNREGTFIKSAPLRKESPRGEECDPSNKCIDDKDNLVACLRVPGNESPDLSLLIQNKGKGPLTVMISAPDFVQLEEKKIQLQGKEDRKVRVSIGNSGTGNTITLTAGSGSCRLNFRHLIGHHSITENVKAPKLTYAGFMTRTPALGIISLAALLMMAFTCICVSLRRKHFSSSAVKYQKVDAVIPVSAGEEAESNANDGWDKSWGDGWDDEEAAVTTPTKPVTPSVSSKGLASRRFNKEGWKD